MKKLNASTITATILLIAGLMIFAFASYLFSEGLNSNFHGGLEEHTAKEVISFLISFSLIVASFNIFIVQYIKNKKCKKRMSYISAMTLLKSAIVIFLLISCLTIIETVSPSEIFVVMCLAILPSTICICLLTMAASLIMFIIYFISWLIRLRQKTRIKKDSI